MTRSCQIRGLRFEKNVLKTLFRPLTMHSWGVQQACCMAFRAGVAVVSPMTAGRGRVPPHRPEPCGIGQ